MIVRGVIVLHEHAVGFIRYQCTLAVAQWSMRICLVKRYASSLFVHSVWDMYVMGIHIYTYRLNLFSGDYASVV